MIGIGLLEFLGKFFEPIMRPIFRLPGSTALVLAMGFTSGFPMGAVAAKRLFEENLISAEEAERLVSFTNNASPLFIIGVVGTGLFNNPAAGYLLAFSHYLSNLLVGFILARQALTSNPSLSHANTLRHKEHSKSTNPGLLLREAVKNGMNNSLTVGGFVIAFSVITSLLTLWNVIPGMSHFFQVLGLSYPVGFSLSVGFFEMTLGIKSAALSSLSSLEKVLTASAILAWSGLSVQAQAIGMSWPVPIRFSYYVKARLIQMLLSLVTTLAGFHLFSQRWVYTAVLVKNMTSLNMQILHPLNTCFMTAFIFLGLTAILAAFVAVGKGIKRLFPAP